MYGGAYQWGSRKIYARATASSKVYAQDVTLLISRFCVFLVLGVFFVHVEKVVNCGDFAFFGR